MIRDGTKVRFIGSNKHIEDLFTFGKIYITGGKWNTIDNDDSIGILSNDKGRPDSFYMNAFEIVKDDIESHMPEWF